MIKNTRFADRNRFRIGPRDLAWLRETARLSPLRRARICLHRDHADPVQEMLIAVCLDSQVPPHRQRGKRKSYTLIEGEMLVTFFDPRGEHQESVRLQAAGGGLEALFSFDAGDWHTVEALGELCIYLEVIAGPYRAENTEFMTEAAAPRPQSGAVTPLVAAQKLERQNEEVYYVASDPSTFSAQDVDFLVTQARRNARGRARICAHPNTEAKVHEMLIALRRGSYVRPHRHFGKSESFHLIQGQMRVVLFEEDGRLRSSHLLSAAEGGGGTFFRLDRSIFHTVLPLSDPVVFHETTSGPFVADDCEFASWAPREDEGAAASYLDWLIGRQA